MRTRTFACRKFDHFVKRSGMSERGFGLNAVNDAKFLPRLRAGRNISLARIERAEAYITAFWRTARR